MEHGDDRAFSKNDKINFEGSVTKGYMYPK